MRTTRTQNLILAAVAMLALSLGGGCAAGQNTKPATPASDSGFSFAAYGDSRTMMYLPYRKDQEAEARALMTEMWSLQLSPKDAEEAVKRTVKFTYDPVTHEMV